MKLDFAGRSGSAENTAEAGQVSKPVACTPILPKVFEWTEARREYRRAYTVYRMSLRYVSADERYTRKHWFIYDSLCMEFDIYYSYSRRVWRGVGGKV